MAAIANNSNADSRNVSTPMRAREKPGPPLGPAAAKATAAPASRAAMMQYQRKRRVDGLALAGLCGLTTNALLLEVRLSLGKFDYGRR